MPSDGEMCSKVLFQVKTLDFFTGLDTFVTISFKKYAADKPSLDVMMDDRGGSIDASFVLSMPSDGEMCSKV